MPFVHDRDVIGNLDENGYLTAPLEELAEKTNHSLDELEDSLCVIQDLDPLGVGARNLQECLTLQVSQACSVEMGEEVEAVGCQILGV